jgi:hypothetical protein
VGEEGTQKGNGGENEISLKEILLPLKVTLLPNFTRLVQEELSFLKK